MISTRTRFALHGLCYLAKVEPGEPTSFSLLYRYMQSWSDRLVLSKGYVSKVFQDLSRAGLVRAVPGRHGGYRLARPAGETTLLDVVRAVEGHQENECCLHSDGACSFQDRCGVVSMVQEAELAFFQVLGKQTLESMARKMPLPETALPGRKSVRGRI